MDYGVQNCLFFFTILLLAPKYINFREGRSQQISEVRMMAHTEAEVELSVQSNK